MPDIDDIISRLLNDRRIREGAAFSSRTYSDQPIIERGRDYQQRVANREQRLDEREQRNTRRREALRRISVRQREREAKREAQEAQRRQEQEETLRKEREAALRSGTGEYDPKRRTFDQRTRQDKPRGNQPGQRRLFFGVSSPEPSPAPDLPEKIRELRDFEESKRIAKPGAKLLRPAHMLFIEAQLMEDYEDDFEFHGTFPQSQMYPLYRSMTDEQLRGYFSWRTKARAGNVTYGPTQFAQLYAYELLMGIGTTPGEQGYRDLDSFSHAWAEASVGLPNGLSQYLTRWMHDYAIYHGLVDELSVNPLFATGKQAFVLLCAEHAQLAREGREPRIPNQTVQGRQPTQEELFDALCETATYHLADARLAKAEPELVASVATDVFAALVSHCSKRRKTDFVEGFFGYAYRTPYSMFPMALFYEEEPHPDTTVTIDDFETFTCTNGHWTHYVPIERCDRNKELGSILHRVDYELRRQLDYAYPLKEKPVPKYLEKLVRDAATARLEERAEAERRRITIDLSKLHGIRAAAAVTQEALLTDEERGIEPSAEEPIVPVASEPPVAPQPITPTEEPHAAPLTPKPTAAPADTSVPAPTDSPLSPLERRFLQGLLDGAPASQLLGPTDPFVSVVADSINETFFDLVGDAVIEFDGDEPILIEDYLDDIREVL